MKSALITLVFILVASHPAWAGRIIVNEQDLSAIFFVHVKNPVEGTDFLRLFNRSVDFTNSCEAKSAVYYTENKDKSKPNMITDFGISINSTCLWAALYLYEEVRKDIRFEVSLAIPKPGMTGSN